MTPIALFVLLLLSLGAARPALAQTAAADAVPLTLERAVHDAQEANAAVRVARAGVDESAAGVAVARATRFPRVTLSEGWQRGDQPIFVFSTLLASRRFAASNFAIDELNHPEPLGYFHATAGLEQVLFDGGARKAGIEAARAQARIADSLVRETSHAVTASVVEAYGQVLAAQAMRRAMVSSLESGREDLARATRRRDAGLATEADVLALAVHVADLEQRAIDAAGRTAIAQAQVNRLTGAPIGRVFEAVETGNDAGAPVGALPALLEEADANRPERARAAAARQVAEANRRRARAAFVPSVAGQAMFDVSGTRVNDRAASWLVGGEVRWSLPLAGSERAQVSAATAAVARAQAEADDVQGLIQLDVVSAAERLRSAQARQRVGRLSIEQARESHRIVRDRYEAGLAPVNDLLRAATALLDADTLRISALVDALTARAQLDRALGRQP